MKDRNALYEKFIRVEWLLRKRQMVDAQNRNLRFDTTRGQGRILATLNLKDGISTKDLSYILGIRIPSLNETLAKLEKAELIERRQSEQDKRILLVYLTQKGHEEMACAEQTDETNFFACFTDEERNILEEYLDRLISSTEQILGEQSEEFSEHMKRLEEERERIFEETGMLGNGFLHRPGHHPPRPPKHGPEGPAPRPPRGPVPGPRGPIPGPKAHVPERMPEEYFEPDYYDPMLVWEMW